jgi:hypothetical protein
MAANVLNSPQAVEISVYVVRAFVRMRHLLAAHKELTGKLEALERKIRSHNEQIQTIFEAIRQLMTPPEPKKTKDRIPGTGASRALRKSLGAPWRNPPGTTASLPGNERGFRLLTTAQRRSFDRETCLSGKK